MTAPVAYVDLLKAGRLGRNTLFLLTGADPAIHQDVVSRLTRGLVQEPDLNFLHVRCSESTPHDDMEAFADEYPMLSKHRLLWIDGADKLSAASRTRLAAYLGRRSPSTVLVLSSGQAGGKRPASRKEAAGPAPEDVAAAEGLVVVCEVRAPKVPWDKTPDDRAAWLAFDLEKRGQAVTAAGRQELLARLGTSLAELRSEMDKLYIYMGTRSPIDRRDVQAVVCRSVVGSMQEMSGLLQRKDAEGAVRLYRELIKGGAAWPMVLGYVSAILRPTADARLLQKLVETDVMAKSGTDAELAVELLIVSVCKGLESPQPPMVRPKR